MRGVHRRLLRDVLALACGGLISTEVRITLVTVLRPTPEIAPTQQEGGDLVS